ncbi:putative aldehyde dehydrogenase [Streptomyces viridiviolaceus]|uniref:aldehyde dehydrogenase (NAD(+)) n=1 Tax=Streptomyces viridiviolaceus TaxID=68282 RepID=A0ABW2DWH0_9ACTN|nr:aldehyde dehydrogenase [Streptomyces viridiviolaceus]GHB73585.1 putative aldehyde dehydrogenase [Streptomyces viridiviolaceus]
MVWQGNYGKLYIGGRWVAPSVDGETIPVVSPSTEEEIARVPAASHADVDRAVEAARTAFDQGPWPRMKLEERIGALRGLSARLAEHESVMAELVTAEMGCPITQSHAIQALRPRLILDTMIELAPKYPFDSLRDSATGRARVTREPVGVVAAVVPWNAPHLVTMMKLAPALLAGCTVVLKPSPETPLDAYLLAELIDRSGIPDGVVSVVPAHREVSEYLVSHPGVDKVSFTGSTAAGRRIAAVCGQAVRRVTLELGGKSAAIVLDDADLDATLESLRVGAFRNTGQVCSAKTRVLVSRRRAKDVIDGLVELTAAMPVGDPFDPETEFGPLVTAQQRERVEGYIRSGRASGATVAYGGGRPEGPANGWFVEPTLFSKVESSMRIAQEEIFGPVLSILEYDHEDEAVAMANDSEYGLNGSIFTADVEHALDLATRIRTGTVEINGNPAGLSAPSGGYKCSGIGRELGLEGFDSFVEIKSVGLPRT